MTYSQATQYWLALDPSQKQMFYDIASKSEGQHTAFEWFVHLVPDQLKDDPSHVEVYMQGGTVTTADGTTYEVPDRDVSRIQSGDNGGEYTTDNTIMENSSVNRSRGADDMTSTEYQQAEAANAADVDIIDTSTVPESTDIVLAGSEETGSIVLESVAESALSIVGDLLTGAAAAEAAMAARNHLFTDMDQQSKDIATIATGTAVWFLYDANPIFMLGRFGWKVLSKLDAKASARRALPPVNR